jgi:ribosome biogenesis GTPase A
MPRELQRCDAVIEVHDARIPFTGRNYKFDLLGSKPRVLVLNKADLAGPNVSSRVHMVREWASVTLL